MKRILIVVPSLIVLYAVTGFLVVPRVITAVVPERLSSALGRPFRLGAVAFNPFTLSLRIDGAALDDPDGGKFVSVGAITANAELESILTATPTLASLVIRAPAARVVRNADGRFNFSDLLAARPSQTASPAAPATNALPAFLVRRLIVTDAQLHWRDNAVAPSVAAAVTKLSLDAGGLGSRRKKPGTFRASVETDLGVTVRAEGEVHLAAPSSRGHVQITGLPLAPLAPYAAPYFKGRIDSGAVGIDFDYQFPSGPEGMGLPAVRQANVTLTGLRVSPPKTGAPLVDLQRLTVTDVNLEPAESFLGIGAIGLSDTRVDLVRQAGGELDLLDLLILPVGPGPPAAPGGAGARPWRLALAAFSASGVSARITDRAAATPAILELGNVDMALSGLRLTTGRSAAMPTVEDARLAVSDMRLSAAAGGSPMLSVPRFGVDGVRFVPDQRTVRLASVTAEGGDLRLYRDRAGAVNLLSALTPSRPERAAADSSRHTPPPTSAPEPGRQPPADPADTPKWVVQMDTLAISDFKAAMTDLSTAMAPSVSAIGNIAAGLSGLTLTAGSPLPRIGDAHLFLKDMRLSAADAPTDLVAVRTLDIAGVQLDPDSGGLTIASVTTAGGDITAARNPDGSIDLLNALLPKAAPPPPAPTSPQTAPVGPSADPFAALPVVVTLKSAALSAFQIGFTDHSLRENTQIKVKDLSLQIDKLTTARNGTGEIRLHVVNSRDGTLTASGKIAINPPSAALNIKCAGFSLIPGQPYFSEKINALVTKGKLDSEGVLTAALKDSLHLRYTGNAAVNKFGSVDKKNVRDLLNWESLYISGIDVSLSPLKVRLDEVALTDYYARVAVNVDGSVNLKDALAPEAGSAQPAGGASAGASPQAPAFAGENAQTAPPVPDVQIAKVTLQGGVVDFSDNSIQPSFETRMLDLGGTISGLSSEQLARADVFLAGRLKNQSPLKITGQINPLIEDRYSDIQIEFSDIELSPFSPYTGKYIGRQLDKGKLTLVLGYKVSGKKLAGENKVYLDQLTLGDPVDSPEAINLPLDLAIALLKDPSGRIQLDLPVRGNLEDPEFSLAGVVIQLLLNTITKIVTAPFAALGGMLGGGPELSYVDFEAGKSALTPEATEKLQLLVTAMSERPAVDIEVQGQINPEPDGLSLREQRLADMLREEKLRDLLKKNPSTPPEAAERLTVEDFAVYIARVYDRTDMAKPRNPDGTIKALPPEEMKKLIFANIAITEADLRRLAIERAEAAKGFIVNDKRIDSRRVFLREPDLTPEMDAEGKPAVQFSRVNFAIRS